jgi:DNA-directed RNA polymerase subunit RPC12/RpoP
MKLKVECPLCGRRFRADHGGDIRCNDCGESFSAAANTVALR